MKTINYIQPNTRSYYFKTNEGKYFAPTWAWDAKYDMANGVYYPITDPEFKQVDFPTLNELVKDGVVSEVNDNYSISRESWRRSHEITQEEIDEICNEFRANGYNVTEDAIRHNFYAWSADLKSGYLGDGFFLFSPCGCNSIEFRAEHIYENSSYQKTYEA